MWCPVWTGHFEPMTLSSDSNLSQPRLLAQAGKGSLGPRGWGVKEAES